MDAMAVSFTPLPGDVFDQAKPDEKNSYQGQNNGPCVERKLSYWCLGTWCLGIHFLILCISRDGGWLVLCAKRKTHSRPVSGFRETKTDA
jgi:hypothetical protein